MLRVKSHGSARSACDDGVVLRSVTLGLVLCILAAACALVEQPGETRMVQVRTVGAVELTVTTPTGVLPGAVDPASLPAGSMTNVTLHVPIDENWAITVNGSPDVLGSTIEDWAREECLLVIELTNDHGAVFGCVDHFCDRNEFAHRLGCGGSPSPRVSSAPVHLVLEQRRASPSPPATFAVGLVHVGVVVVDPLDDGVY